MHPQLFLASSSPYRRSLLMRLGLQFNWAAPSINESSLPGEPPESLVERLSKNKGAHLHKPDQITIASDQIAFTNGQILGKPLTKERATTQLTQCSNNTVTFYTGLSVKFHDQEIYSLHTTTVRFIPLSASQIDRYIDLESPLDCAGSFKCEGLGISLFSSIHSNDPTGLEGLPLIKLTLALRKYGVDPLN